VSPRVVIDVAGRSSVFDNHGLVRLARRAHTPWRESPVASVIGHGLWSPGTMWVERRLTELRILVSKLPLVDPADNWEHDPASGGGVRVPLLLCQSGSGIPRVEAGQLRTSAPSPQRTVRVAARIEGNNRNRRHSGLHMQTPVGCERSFNHPLGEAGAAPAQQCDAVLAGVKAKALRVACGQP
jgi:hypothetical protein